jgi:ABC-2 type transport system permease protein
MAIMFLMFTATAGGRSVLAERDAGTLPRMLASPTSPAQVLGGKVMGTYTTGVGQMGILLLASGLIFGVRWGEPLAVTLVVLALVAAATGWGMVIAAYARTPGQANAIGTMMALIFGGLAGNFVPRQLLPEFLQKVSYITPNAWGLEAFGALSAGGGLADVVVSSVALLAMAAVLFGVSVAAFRRQYQ